MGFDQNQTEVQNNLKEESSLKDVEVKKMPLANESSLSWANLFKKQTNHDEIRLNTQYNAKEKAPSKVINNNIEEKYSIESKFLETRVNKNLKVMYSEPIESLRMLGNLFKSHELKHSAYALEPRGIINRQNWCYINAVN